MHFFNGVFADLIHFFKGVFVDLTHFFKGVFLHFLLVNKSRHRKRFFFKPFSGSGHVDRFPGKTISKIRHDHNHGSPAGFALRRPPVKAPPGRLAANATLPGRLAIAGSDLNPVTGHKHKERNPLDSALVFRCRPDLNR